LSPTLRFLPEAVKELEEAVLWYRKQTPFLGNQFTTAFESTIERMIQFQDAFPLYRKSVRRALIPKFPYGIFYVQGINSIQILAVFHLKQDPHKLNKRA